MKIDAEVLAVLTNASIVGHGVALVGQLDRKLYVKVNKVLELLGGKWNRSKKAHVFPEDPRDVLADAITTGTVVDHKKEFQFFETPEAVVDQLVQLANITRKHIVLEPSAGNGAIAKKLTGRCAEVFVCELQDKLRIALESSDLYNVLAPNFLDVDPEIVGGFDRIVANPPFTKGQDVEHVTHMLKLLNRHGRLVSIMSPGWTFRDDRKHREFREMVQEYIDADMGQWVLLPPGSFKQSGTMVQAGILVLDAGE